MSPVRDMSIPIEKDVKESVSIFKSQFTEDSPRWKAYCLLWICEDSEDRI